MIRDNRSPLSLKTAVVGYAHFYAGLHAKVSALLTRELCSELRLRRLTLRIARRNERANGLLEFNDPAMTLCREIFIRKGNGKREKRRSQNDGNWNVVPSPTP